MRHFQQMKLTQPQAVSGLVHCLLFVLCLVLFAPAAFGQSFFTYPPNGTLYSQSISVPLDTAGTDTAYFFIPTNAGRFIHDATLTPPDSLKRIDNLYRRLSSVEFSILRTDSNYVDSLSVVIFPVDEYFSPLPGSASYGFADSLADGSWHRLVVTDSIGTAFPFGFGLKVSVGDTLPSAVRVKSLLGF